MTRSRNAPAPAYEKDLVAWLEDQARRARRDEGLDLENVAEELEGMARSDRRKIRSRLSILLTHLLKCTAHPKKPSSSWLGTIADQRDGIADRIEDSPSFRDYPAEIFERCYPRARCDAARQMLRPCPKKPFPRAAPAGSKRHSTRWLPRRAESCDLENNVVRFRLSEYKLL